MEPDELSAELHEAAELLQVRGQGHPREVDLQKLGVPLPIARRVEDGVDVVEDVLRPEGRLTVSPPVGDEFEAELLLHLGDELGAEVRDAAVFSRRPVGAGEGFLAGGIFG